ncbi:hypothetical protein BDZ89DRAFT_1075246, partial [Hymenopellis radicata]
MSYWMSSRPSGPGCELGRYVPLRPWARARTTFSNNFPRHYHPSCNTADEHGDYDRAGV